MFFSQGWSWGHFSSVTCPQPTFALYFHRLNVPQNIYWYIKHVPKNAGHLILCIEQIMNKEGLYVIIEFNNTVIDESEFYFKCHNFATHLSFAFANHNNVPHSIMFKCVFESLQLRCHASWPSYTWPMTWSKIARKKGRNLPRTLLQSLSMLSNTSTGQFSLSELKCDQHNLQLVKSH